MSNYSKTGFEVYQPTDGDIRAFFVAENPRRVRTVILPVSSHLVAGRIAERWFADFAAGRPIAMSVRREFRSVRLSSLVYQYVGFQFGRMQKVTALIRGRELRALFGACGWHQATDATEERFLRWRSDVSVACANRVLREVCSFFDSLVEYRALRANPLRFIRELEVSSERIGRVVS